MNRNSLVLFVLLSLIGVAAFAAIGWQRDRVLPPEGLVTEAVSSGGLIINSVIIPGDTTPLVGTEGAAAVPSLPAPAADAAACP